MEDADAAPDDPVALLVRIPRHAHARAPGLLRGIEYVVLHRDLPVRNLVLERRALAEGEVAEYGVGRARIRIAVVVKPHAISQRQVRLDFPGVLNEQAEGFRSGVPIPQDRLAGDRVVGHGGLGEGLVLHQVEQIVEVESRLGVRTLELLDVIAEPSLVSELERCGSRGYASARRASGSCAG